MIAYLDCTSGVSGDKFLGALVDAGLEMERLRAGLAGLGLPGWELEAAEVHRAGFRGLHVRVVVGPGQPSRDWAAIRALIGESALDGLVKERALDAFGLLAQAEADAHGTSVDDVHFHEVGAVDSIIDIVGAAFGMEALGIVELHCSPVAVGSGTVECSHGLLPVPAPATTRLLEGVPSYGGPQSGELTTPTGAALVRAFATAFGPMPAMTPRATGHGAGSRETDTPNLLRLIVGEPVEGDTSETVVVLRSAIDHRTPEELAHALEVVRAEGALDVWQSPILMKKGRSAVEVTVIARPHDAGRVADSLMRETGTLGVRREFTERVVAPRAVVSVATSFGEVRFKVAVTGGIRHLRPEHDDVARVARETGLPAHEAAARLTAEAQEALGDQH